MSSDLSYPSCVDRTNAFLKDKIIIAESAHVIDNFFIRVDLLVKTGSLIEIYEVKSKSNSSKDSFFKVKNGFTEVKKNGVLILLISHFNMALSKTFFMMSMNQNPYC